ncbi:head morphogenesis protein [Pantoea phage vB_PagM_AAM22]|nr:head morphogenesis protein [Pantoea phage vB_PagM_AAM22]
MPTQAEIAYNRKLQQIVKLVRADIDVELIPAIKQSVPEYVADAWSDVIAAALQRLVSRWTSPFARQQAREIAGSFVTDASTRAMRKTVGIDLYGGNDQLIDYLKAAADQNAALITSIPAQYLEQVSNIVTGNMRAGMRPSYIEQALVKQFGVTQRRAKLIARDQTSKIQGEITRIRQVNSGITYFRWLTAHDERVRPSHVAVGKRDVGYGPGVFKWGDLPVVDGVPTFPGQPINCRCVAVPVTAAQVERNRKSKA